jgi:hypothetical protein
MAPVAATLTRHLDARVTLCAGALVMCLAYLGRTVLSDSLWQIVVGSVLVSMGTSLAYAAMPTLIMAAVPLVQTASANGLNTLLRSVGTSTSSAATAALLAVGVHSVRGALPAFGAIAAVFWIAAAAAAIAALLTVPLFRTTSSVRGSDGAPVVLVDAAGDTATADLSSR